MTKLQSLLNENSMSIDLKALNVSLDRLLSYASSVKKEMNRELPYSIDNKYAGDDRKKMYDEINKAREALVNVIRIIQKFK